MHYLYKITNQINHKVYIGQSIEPKNRWKKHQSYAKNSDKPAQYIHHAIAKYGVENFIFEVIDVGLNQYQADCLELNYIKQYDSQNPIAGYNIRAGGHTASHSEETKKKQSDATKKQIETKGHPAQGTKRTPEQIQILIQARKDNPVEYTEEKRKNMSEAHVGIKDTEETKNKKSESAKIAWEKRQTEREATGMMICNAPNCDIIDIPRFYIINNVRYCSVHAQRLRKHGALELMPRKQKSLNKITDQYL